MSFFFQRSKTRTYYLKDESKIIDLTSSYKEYEDLVCNDCGIIMLYFPNHPDVGLSVGYYYICPKCNQVMYLWRSIDKKEVKLGIMADNEAAMIQTIEDEPLEVKLQEKMKNKERQGRSIEIL